MKLWLHFKEPKESHVYLDMLTSDVIQTCTIPAFHLGFKHTMMISECVFNYVGILDVKSQQFELNIPTEIRTLTSLIASLTAVYMHHSMWLHIVFLCICTLIITSYIRTCMYELIPWRLCIETYTSSSFLFRIVFRFKPLVIFCSAAYFSGAFFFPFAGWACERDEGGGGGRAGGEEREEETKVQLWDEREEEWNGSPLPWKSHAHAHTLAHARRDVAQTHFHGVSCEWSWLLPGILIKSVIYRAMELS